MALFEVTTPDGTYKVTAPNNATDPEDLLREYIETLWNKFELWKY
jgi:hypothetical protein